MRAMAIEGYGDADCLRQMALPRPKPGRGEMLLRVVSAGVSPVDALIRSGALAEHIPGIFPIVLGWDAAGVVEEFGPGAGRFRKGDRVWACARKPTAQWGCYAEYVAVSEDAAGPMPARLLFEEAAAVPLCALAAYQCLVVEPAVQAGQSVLIHGAAGGVGHFAVQLAKLQGARVLASASTDNQSFVLGLGAAVCIDSGVEAVHEAARRHIPDGVDLALDLVGGERLELLYETVKPGGRLISLAAVPDPSRCETAGIAGQARFVEPNAAQLEQIARHFDNHTLKTHVQKIYPLARAAEAHRALEQGHVRGKLVLNL